VLDWPTEISVLTLLSAFGVAAAVGIVFGYYPARRASRLDPIESLRYE
jgi:ABC-type antimicrobial peptide transport system permease subunit